MAKEWNMGICNEKSGFLFSHECFRSPIGNCSSCQKPVCEDHSHAFDGNVLCTSCAKKDRKRRGRDETGRQYGPSRHYDDHDPYFYGGYYYGATYYDSYHHHGSSVHDPHDFTEADAESLASEGDEGFESDMSES